MKPNVQFVEEHTPSKLRLLPIGQGFLPLEELQELNDSMAINLIASERRHFQSLQYHQKNSAERGTERKTRTLKPYICKSAYILSRKMSTSNEEELIALLADSSTLFSYDYQIYSQHHNFYREVRTQQGKSTEQQNQYCRERALKDIGPERALYNRYLIQLEDKAVQENWSPEQLEENLIDQALSRLVLPEEINAFWQWAESKMTDDDFIRGFSEGLPEIELSRQDSKRFSESFFYLIRRDESAKAEYYKQALVYSFPELCSVYPVLQQWIPGFELSEEKRRHFISCVLYTYICARKRVAIEKSSAGHYTPTYRICDKTSCETYLKTKKQLTDLWERHKNWKKADLNTIFGNAETKDNYSISSSVSRHTLPVQLGQIFPRICDATKKYFASIGGDHENIDVNYIQSIIFEMDYLSMGISHFPFCYMMICIAGTSSLFSTHKSISGEHISKFLRKPYYKSVPRNKQRISRIRFLDNLNTICNLEKGAQSSSWKLFLQVHGASIESPEEAALWRKILYGQSPKIGMPRVDIPPVELSLCCEDRLRQCLPVQEQYLYCYSSSSALQTGGYAAFLRDHPNVLDGCIRRIKRGTTKQASPTTSYLKACSGLTYDVDYIQRICEDLAGSIRWGTITCASPLELQQFCASLYKNETATEDEISDNVRELKNLLIETSLRHILAEEASSKLREKVEEVFNEGTAFKISLSSF